ncbi:MAG: hypothetical protein AAGF59_11645 [Pseudomonadota bacterium]
MLKRFASFMIAFNLTALALVALPTAAIAEARCSATPESGVWVNPDARQSSLARLEVRTTCAGGTHGWKVRALTRCSRTLCSWGYSEGVRRPDGALAVLFDTFQAERLVRMSVDRDVMRVAVISIFRGGRGDQVDRYRLKRSYE